MVSQCCQMGCLSRHCIKQNIPTRASKNTTICSYTADALMINTLSLLCVCVCVPVPVPVSPVFYPARARALSCVLHVRAARAHTYSPALFPPSPHPPFYILPRDRHAGCSAKTMQITRTQNGRNLINRAARFSRPVVRWKSS